MIFLTYQNRIHCIALTSQAMLIAVGLLLSACGTPLPEPVQEAYDGLPRHVDFNFDVKPILSDRCFACHGPDDNAREADLRLDSRSGSQQKLASGHRPIVPGNRSRSVLIERILHEDPEERMPPADSRLVLSDREKAVLVKWIDQGAAYEEHWSFLPPELPDMSTRDETVHPIDYFVRKRLASEVLEPAGEASRETWLRRVSFDLTGLPPTIEEMDAFLADSSVAAYQRVVDRLLASPHYGERMAVDWLDLARYADTHGYQDDGFRFVWPWRNWVVKAFNQNLPYDLFGDVSSDYTGGSLDKGTVTISATPYAGDAGPTSSISFDYTRVDDSIGIQELRLIETHSYTDLGQVLEGFTYNFTDPTFSYTIQAETFGDVDRVNFYMDPQGHQQTEYAPPYALFGDQQGDYFDGAFDDGHQVIRAVAYNQDGIPGYSHLINITVVAPPGEQPAGNASVNEGTRLAIQAPSESFNLLPAFPNPFSASTTIQFDLPESAVIRLSVYDLLGREVKTLVDERKGPGLHSIEFDATSLPNGSYIYRLETPASLYTRQLVLIK